MSVFKLIRVVLLLSILFVLVVGTWMAEKRMAAWERPILVTVYPIAADDSPGIADFVEEIDERVFDPVNAFFDEQASPYGFSVTPAFRFQIARPSAERPPEPPGQFDPVAVGLWSLKMRWWAFRRDLGDDLVSPDVQMFVLYHGVNGVGEMGISVGMRKGRYGIVKAVARESAQPTNLVVFTHELLHVLGATDKYVITTGEPIYPDGYAEPQQQPLFPQTRAEIMGGRIPLSAVASVMPKSLEQCKVGRLTAEEIGFMDKLMPY